MLIYILILLIIIPALFGYRLLLMTGLLYGSVLSILKFRTYAAGFRKILGNSLQKKPLNASVRSAAVFTLNQFMLLPLLYMAYKLDEDLFSGIAAGILIIPFVVFTNAVTEITGITHNNFQ